MKYKFQHTNYDDSVLTLEFEAESMEEVVLNIKCFLLGAVFTNRTVEDYFND
mgnify:CR=1 FL=1